MAETGKKRTIEEVEDKNIPCSVCGKKKTEIGIGLRYTCIYCNKQCCWVCMRSFNDKKHGEWIEHYACKTCFEVKKCDVCKITENGKERMLKNCYGCGKLCCKTCINDIERCAECTKNQTKKQNKNKINK